MLGRSKQQFRAIFVYHGLLVLAVLVTAYLSVRAQYAAMRDQQLEEARADQQQTVRSAAQRLQQQIRLLLVSLSTSEHDQLVERWSPQNWFLARGTLDATSGKVLNLAQGSAADLTRAIRSLPALKQLDKPAVITSGGNGESAIVTIAVPSANVGQVTVATLSATQISQDLSSGLPQNSDTQLLLTTDQGLVFASTTAVSNDHWVQWLVDPLLRDQVNAFFTAGRAGSALVDSEGLSLIAQQSFEPVPSVRWHVIALRTELREAIRVKLRPLFWQLLTQASLTVVAMVIVLVSTTTHLLEGRRRIERLRTEMLNRDLQKARRIQLNWLPAPYFRGDHLSIAAENRPAAHISGDFYNWFDLPAGEEDSTRKTVVVIGDVSGHGMPAAFLMATTQLMVRNTMPGLRDPGLCLAEVNRQLCSLVYNGQFVTMLILVIDHDNATIHVASAGHHPPLLKRNGVIESLPIDPQLVLGVDESVEFQTHRMRAMPNDVLLLYTDGAIEASNEEAEQFGPDRLREAFGACDNEPAEVLKCIVERLTAFHGPEDPDDDLTLLAIRLAPVAVAEPSTQGNPTPARAM
ncbi:MAG: PP2C family protein-serine/threonine phosphatase [Tepidisphaeraceae bacterium]